MTYSEFLKRIINDGIEAAKADYTKPDQASHLKGSVEGFEACEGKMPAELVELLGEARKRSMRARDEEDLNSYWEHHCFELEVEWVVNCVSAILVNQGSPALTSYHPTARAVMKAAEVTGTSTIQ